MEFSGNGDWIVSGGDDRNAARTALEKLLLFPFEDFSQYFKEGRSEQNFSFGTKGEFVLQFGTN